MAGRQRSLELEEKTRVVELCLLLLVVVKQKTRLPSFLEGEDCTEDPDFSEHRNQIGQGVVSLTSSEKKIRGSRLSGFLEPREDEQGLPSSEEQGSTMPIHRRLLLFTCNSSQHRRCHRIRISVAGDLEER
ncbi:hypothetical protein MRB53_028492 [Persea americana]|uniref:Uncharacterized protein n=1 Tax=Persea americana TaxID=3435 RepID=A0ACC2KGB5_PERAE|nr:hypothetical protein MRB53_028492 [Persea americana]